MGHANAEVEIGFGHLTGAFLPQNISKAREIFNRRAAKGNPRAQAVRDLYFLFRNKINYFLTFCNA